MSSSETLYNLLPAIYRLRDNAEGEPLRALLGLIETQHQALKSDIDGLYENWFIETCENWVVPYIGDLLRAGALVPVAGKVFSERAYVAHTLGYRRGKGTARTVRQLARDVTGWPAAVVEFFQLLATTQYLNHLRPQSPATVDLRDSDALELLGGPFEGASRTVDVRHIARNRGRYNIPNLGIFLWRLQDYPITRGTPRAVEPVDGRFTFSPLGFDAPLFNSPKTLTEPTQVPGETNVPGTLRRLPLFEELEARRQAVADGSTPAAVYFDAEPVLELFVDNVAVPPEEIMICDLADWRRPPTTRTYVRSSDGATVSLPIRASVDPVLGRLAFPAGVIPRTVEVSYAYGFSGDVGGGPYDRGESVAAAQTGVVNWQAGVTTSLAPRPGLLYSTFAAAVQAWNTQPAGTSGVIAVLDSHSYPESLTGANQIVIPKGSRLLIVAADWPGARPPGDGQQKQLVPENLRPHLLGDISIRGTAPVSSALPGSLIINGLLIEGALHVEPGNLAALRFEDSTLTPNRGGIAVAAGGAPGERNEQLVITLRRAICGPIVIAADAPQLNITDSIVCSGQAADAAAPAITAPAATADIQSSTVFGSSEVQSLDASNSIFTGLVTAIRRQTGCVRFCYVPPGSTTARRYHCQPDLALKDIDDPAARAAIMARVTPAFSPGDYGQPAFAQLSPACPAEIRIGAEDGSEMGAFDFLKQPQREGNLRASLDEYLRFGLEAGLIYVT